MLFKRSNLESGTRDWGRRYAHLHAIQFPQRQIPLLVNYLEHLEAENPCAFSQGMKAASGL